MDVAIRNIRGNLERLFDKNLTDLVRGIRNNKDNEAKYIAQCIEEIKQELRQDNMAVKVNAVQKLTYIQMLGYDISWASFNIVEVMSSPKFTYKRVGYLAASQSFHPDTEVLMLTTNMIRKDLNSQTQYDSAVALTSLSCFISTDLARDLANDVMTLLSSTKPYLRKKAVLLMYKIFLKFPEALRPAFPRLKDKLDDPDPGVQSAAVNVICELARKNPQNYLGLAPVFFKLMTSSTNNWMLIKIIKLFGALTTLEPRLGRKLIEPLTNLIHSTSAMSLLYECINTVIAVLISISSGMPSHNASIQLCVQKLRILIEDSDQNLKYLGLLAMGKILQSHPKSVTVHKDLIMQCLDDKDESIRLRALDLLYGMVSKKNLMEIVKKLMVHMDRAEGSTYRDELLSKLIFICSQNNYQFVTNFEWYLSVLVELTRIEGSQHGPLVAAQMMDVTVRVVAIRHFAVAQMALLLDNAHVLATAAHKNTMLEVLYAAAWICGEFAEYLPNIRATVEAMLRTRTASLPPHILAVYVQNVLKLYARMLARAEQSEQPEDVDGAMVEVNQVAELMIETLPTFASSADLEVQERATSALQLMKTVQKLQSRGERLGAELQQLFSGELNPVAPKAQKKVPVPEGLNLDEWINEPSDESADELETADYGVEVFVKAENRGAGPAAHTEKRYQPTAEELRKSREARAHEQAHNPHYLKGSLQSSGANYGGAGGSATAGEMGDVPVQQLDINVPLRIGGLASSDDYLKMQNRSYKSSKKNKKKKKKKGEPKSSSDEDAVPVVHEVSVGGEMPEGARSSEDEKDTRPADDPHRALDINLDEPLAPDEVLPVRSHRQPGRAPPPAQLADTRPEARPKKKKKKDKDEKKRKHKKDKADRETAEGGQAEAGTEQPAAETAAAPANGKNPQDDIEFWLSDMPASTPAEGAADSAAPATSNAELLAPSDPKPAAPAPAPAETAPTANGEATPPETNGEAKQKKHKSAKKSKKSKKKSGRLLGYEEAAGISTPSHEVLLPGLGEDVSESRLRPLAENEHLKLMYEPRAGAADSGEVSVAVAVTNRGRDDLTDVLLELTPKDGVTLVQELESLSLPAGASEEVSLRLRLDEVSVPLKLAASITSKTTSGDSDRLAFKLRLPVTSLLIGQLDDKQLFADLLSGDQLTARATCVVSEVTDDFNQVLHKVAFWGRHTVVEQIDTTASLYSRSVQGDHICLLLKQLAAGRLGIDGKGTNQQLLANVVDELRAIVCS
ncbi:AP-3 complex subunit delta-1-like isoform X2 [Amphibalanus amphitrite]|uniref:AP-3 complex subunit delta-1-like isoform X2 n=1 Tax=Amphibalanus amphitrite TaxID=1232801 RepID=UPI001C91CCC3|nr:AP-3 complex subunit delta-1-like isoform X2 [Amphibalanus amphitrite]